MTSSGEQGSGSVPLLDTHCHLDRYPDPATAALEAERGGIVTIGVTNLPSHFEAGLPHVRKLKRVRLALGLHPLASGSHRAELPAFRRLLAETSYVGEVGLDFSKEGRATRDVQEASFREVLSALAGCRKFVTLHSRGAESRVLELLTEYGVGPVVFHWYTGPLDVLDEVLRLGHFVSVNPAMVRAATGQAVVSRLPRGRVLTETDGPYVRVGSRAARPADVSVVVEHLASVWDSPRERVTATLYENFHTVLSHVTAANPS